MAPEYVISFCNPGGTLAQRTAKTPEEALEALKEMLAEIPYLDEGDSFHVFRAS